MTGGIAMSACTLKSSDGSLICCPVGPASNAVMPDPTPGLYLRTSSRGSDDDEICALDSQKKQGTLAELCRLNGPLYWIIRPSPTSSPY